MDSLEAHSPLFHQVVEQFDAASERIDVKAETLSRLRYPNRSIMVAIPVRLDDGTIQVFTGYRVQHALTNGPGKGGLRYHPAVTLGDVAGMALLMSWKCGLMGLPFGGAKGGVNCDPTQMSEQELERLTRRLTIELIPFIGPMVDVMAPDVGTNEQVMSWIYDTYSMHAGHNVPQIVTGKNPLLYGTLGRTEATGRGVVFNIEEALKHTGLQLEGARVVVQGFGNVGTVVALEMAARGAKVIGISDVRSAVYNKHGLAVKRLLAHAQEGHKLDEFAEGEPLNPDQILSLECEVLVPAAIERVISKDNVEQIRCRILAEAANGPTTLEADRVLRENSDILVIPDILCNAGGVVVSYFEWVQGIQMFFWTEEEVNSRLRQTILKAFHECINYAEENAVDLRTSALVLGIGRVAHASALRGLYP